MNLIAPIRWGEYSCAACHDDAAVWVGRKHGNLAYCTVCAPHAVAEAVLDSSPLIMGRCHIGADWATQTFETTLLYTYISDCETGTDEWAVVSRNLDDTEDRGEESHTGTALSCLLHVAALISEVTR